jgi:hypothetical protein
MYERPWDVDVYEKGWKAKTQEQPLFHFLIGDEDWRD